MLLHELGQGLLGFGYLDEVLIFVRVLSGQDIVFALGGFRFAHASKTMVQVGPLVTISELTEVETWADILSVTLNRSDWSQGWLHVTFGENISCSLVRTIQDRLSFKSISGRNVTVEWNSARVEECDG